MFRNYIEELNIHPDEVIVYLRKSRSDDPLLSVEEVLAKHESILDDWSEKNLGERVPESNKYREVVSGETIADRPEVQKVLKLIESPKIKAILIVEVQRLSRGDLEDAGRLMKLLRFTNTLVITPQWTFDLREEQNRDGFERELKRGNEFLEYTKKIMQRGRLLSVSQGNFVGNVAPYGYTKTWITEGKRKCPTLTPHEEEAKIVYMAFDLYVNKGYSIYGICDHFDKIGITPQRGKHWSSATMRELLGNPVYIGKVRWDYRKTVTVVKDGEISKQRPRAAEHLLYDGKHPALIPEEWYNKSLELLSRNADKTKRGNGIRNPLATLVHCQCGRAMTFRSHRLPDGSYRYSPRLVCNDIKHCGTGSCTYDEFITILKEELKHEISTFEIILKKENKDSARIQELIIKDLEKKLLALDAKELAQWEAQTDPDPTKRMPAEIFAKLNEKLQQEREETRMALQNAKETLPKIGQAKETLVKFTDALRALDDPNSSAEEKHRLLKACIRDIIYRREAPERLRRKPDEALGTSIKHSGATWTNPPIQIVVKYRV